MKNRKTYKILTYVNLMIPFGINRMYLGEKFVGRMLTADYFYMGAIADLFYINKRFDEAMTKRGFVNTNRRAGE